MLFESNTYPELLFIAIRFFTETDVSSEGGISQASTVLTTCNAYHTATGSTDSEWTLNETCIETEPEPDFNGDVLEVLRLIKIFLKSGVSIF